MAVPPATRTPATKEQLAVLDQDAEFFRTVSADELARYGGKWIATRNAEVVAWADTVEELHSELDAGRLEDVCISYMEDPEYTVIYALR